MKALEDIILFLNATEPKGLYCKNIELIKSALERLEKLEKAWEIVKKKNILLSELKEVDDYKNYLFCYGVAQDDLDYYEHGYFLSKLLIETEFNLLKEMLEEK